MKKNEILEKLRKDLGYSRKKIGEILEVSPSTIEKYEKGRLDFDETTRYVLGVCALAGYDNNLFEYEELEKMDEIEHYKLNLFSTRIRQILYFLNIDYEEYFFFLRNFLKKIGISMFLHKSFLNEINNYLLNCQIGETEIKCLKNKKYCINFYEKEAETLNLTGEVKDEYIKLQIKSLESMLYFAYTLQIIFLFTLKFFNPKEFYSLEEINFIKHILANNKTFLKGFDDNIDIDKLDNYFEPPLIAYKVESNFEEDIVKLKQLYPTIKKTIEELEKTGKPVTKETIKEFKLELETGGITTFCPEITDPKDQKILELLHYAPPAFKDKIIEKLEKLRDEVEKF
jgi:transcriptional regulator with XRE-family HTH domain